MAIVMATDKNTATLVSLGTGLQAETNSLRSTGLSFLPNKRHLEQQQTDGEAAGGPVHGSAPIQLEDYNSNVVAHAEQQRNGGMLEYVRQSVTKNDHVVICGTCLTLMENID